MTDEARSGKTGRRIGYLVAIVFNIGFLVVATNLVAWDWFPWLTAEFDEVVPFIVASVTATMVVNLAYLFFDPPWFKSIAELGTLVFSMIATARMLQVFPFDFASYDFSWGTMTRWILGLAIFGMGVAMIVHLAKLAGFARNALEEAAS